MTSCEGATGSPCKNLGCISKTCTQSQDHEDGCNQSRSAASSPQVSLLATLAAFAPGFGRVSARVSRSFASPCSSRSAALRMGARAACRAAATRPAINQQKKHDPTQRRRVIFNRWCLLVTLGQEGRLGIAGGQMPVVFRRPRKAPVEQQIKQVLSNVCGKCENLQPLASWFFFPGGPLHIQATFPSNI